MTRLYGRLAVMASVVIVCLALTSDLNAQCGPCQPQMKSNWPYPHYSVFLDGSLPSAARSAAVSGINMWSSWFTSQGQAAPFAIVTVGPGTIQVWMDPSLAGTGYGATNTGGNLIGVNPDYASSAQAFLTQVLGHEFGHSVGFKDVDAMTSPACAGQTIMFGLINRNASSFVTGLTSTDTCTLAADYSPPPPPPPPPGSTTETTQTGGWGCGSLTCDPLVLDLNGDGVQTSGGSDAVWFDIDGDGVREHVTWTNPNTMEGFLWIDLNHKNRVDNGRELFGVGTVMPDGTTASDGFAALALYDDPKAGGNGDGVIDANDAVWNRLRIWVDSNHNGVCEPGETGPIHEYGVDEIPLGAVIARVKDAAGNTHALQGVYMRRETKNGHSVKTQFAIDSLVFQRVP